MILINKSAMVAIAASVLLNGKDVHSFAPSSPRSLPSLTSLQASSSSTRLVWLTGHEDLRIRDHGGFADAFSLPDVNDNDDGDVVVVPVFTLDPTLHLRCKSPSSIERLHNCVSSLESELDMISGSSSVQLSPLVIRHGSASTILPSLAKEIDATSIHIIADDVTSVMRTTQRTVCNRLEEMGGVKVYRWTNELRPSAPWASSKAEAANTAKMIMPSFFPEYAKIADDLPIPPPRKMHDDLLVQEETATTVTKGKENNNSHDSTMSIHSEGLPSLSELLDLAQSVTPPAVSDFQKRCLSTKCIFRQSGNTIEPYEQLITNQWCTESGARITLEEYCRVGNDSFANKYFTTPSSSDDYVYSMYEAASHRIVMGGDQPSDVLALREAPTRAFSSALALGALSARDVIDAARNRHSTTEEGPMSNNDDGNNSNRAGLLPSDDPLWGRSSEGILSDVIEWREWFRLLADRSLTLQEEQGTSSSGVLPTSGGEKVQGGDPREAGTVNYWRWKGQHLVRYLTWPAGKDYDNEGNVPALLLVHGFAASAEQWERLVYSLRKEYGNLTPPIFAVDLLGFGHSEKPGLSYTQYLWEAQLVDFAVEVMEAVPLVMVGNSIGGGISAGAAASLGKDICKGLVLCNTAGILEDPDTYGGYGDDNDYKYGSGPFRTSATGKVDNAIRSHTEAALKGNPNEAPYTPVPVVGKNALDLFGKGIIQLIYPQIEKRLSLIYANQLENADQAAIYAIQQSANHPGSANVIGSGQKLAPNRPLNEVLVEVAGSDDDSNGFDVLVVMGLNDQVSSPQVAQSRVELFSKLHPAVVVDAVADAGHCPHDEKPDLVAGSIVKWLDNIIS